MRYWQPQGHVYQAVEVNSGRTVALKKSRVPLRVERTILRYESRILQLLQGHPAIPAIYGHGRQPHFEYLAMELLGPSIKSCATGPVAVTTASRTVLQIVCVALSATTHHVLFTLPIAEICHSFPPWSICTNAVSFTGILSPRMCFAHEQIRPRYSSLILASPGASSLLRQPDMIR